MWMIFHLTIKDALIYSDSFELEEAPLLSVILIYISQCRDVITVLLLFSYSDIAVIYVAGQRMIGRCNAACFNAFVDYMPELGDWMLIHCDLRDLSLVKVPHNCEIAADIMRDY